MYAAFAALHADTRERLAGLAEQWASGEWSASGFAAEMDALLLDAHTAAVVIGRQHAGDTAPEEADDRRFAERIVESEHEFLQPFREQMEQNRYAENGVRDASAVADRAQMYADRLTGSANQAWTLTLPEETEVWWILGAEDSSNCDACPAIADGSPYEAATMDGWPGSNFTPCLWNCRCRLETGSDQRGFVTPD